MSVQVANDFSSLYSDTITLSYEGELTRIRTALPASTSQWTLQVLDNNNNVIRSWQATSVNAQLAWDGTDAASNQVADGAYNLQILAYRQNGQYQYLQKPVHKHSTPLFALGLFARILPKSDPLSAQAEVIEKQFRLEITASWEALHKSSSNAFTYLVLGPDDNTGDGTADAVKINKLLHTSVQVFELNAHGTPSAMPGAMASTHWNDVRFDPEEPLAGTGSANSALIGTTIFVPKIIRLKNQSFHFVDLSCCQSAGGIESILKVVTRPLAILILSGV